MFCVCLNSFLSFITSLILNHLPPAQLPLLSKLQKPPLEVAHPLLYLLPPLLLLPLPSLTLRRAERQRSDCCLPC